jgi:hypothetical protein
MVRIVRSLIAGTMPSSTACRARSLLVQWVMCSPLATGSRQANRTISARWRGGNPGGSPGSLRRCEEAGQARALVATADPPDGRGVVLRLDGQQLDRFPGSNAEDDPRSLDLIPGQRPTPGDLLQYRNVMKDNPQGARFSTTHGASPVVGPSYGIQRTGCPEFLALLRARDTMASPIPPSPRMTLPVMRCGE